ncbi:hypothetical protein Tco_0578319 [Tanacetum coccineum]
MLLVTAVAWSWWLWRDDGGDGDVGEERMTMRLRGVNVWQPLSSSNSITSSVKSFNSLKLVLAVLTYSSVCDAIFYERPPTKVRKVKGKEVVPDPYQMVLSEMKLDFKKWETILSENAISLPRNKDHPNVCLVYMLYCLANQKCFNLAYYMAKRMASVIKSDFMMLPYEMLLTRLYRHVHGRWKKISPSNILGIIIFVGIKRLLDDLRVTAAQLRNSISLKWDQQPSPSPTPTQGEIDPVDSFTLDPVVYIDQLPPIPRGASEEFKQTKGMFKCFGHFFSNFEKKKKLLVLRFLACKCRYHLQQRTVPSCRWNRPGRFYSGHLAVEVSKLLILTS